MRTHQSFPAIIISLLCGIFLSAASAIAAPAAPSDLKVTPLGVNSFLMEWKDNSTDETGWDVQIALGSGTPQHFLFLPGANTTSFVAITNPLPGQKLNFAIASYNGLTGAEDISSSSASVQVRALTPSTFGAPTLLHATLVDDGRVNLTWQDNSTSEFGYLMEYKLTTDTAWQTFGSVQPGITFNYSTADYLLTQSLLQATGYSFRVRAYKTSPTHVTTFTAYSNEIQITTKTFQAPTDLVVTAKPEGVFSFSWKDNSSLEYGYEIQGKSGTADFTSLGTVGADITSANDVPNFTYDTDYQFRVRGYRITGTQAAPVTVYTEFSNVVLIKSTPLAAPTSFASSAVTENSITLTWKDNSTHETDYELDWRLAGAAAFTTNTMASNTQTYTLANLQPGKWYELRLRTSDLFSGAKSTYTRSLKIRTKDTITSNLSPPITFGSLFNYTVYVSNLSSLANLTVTGLPAGLTYSATTRKITGTPTVEGEITVTLTATYKNGTSITKNLVLRIIRPLAAPVVTSVIPSVKLAVASSTVRHVAGRFADPDTQSAARLTTTAGIVDVILYSLATPKTVNNFLDYIDAGKYNDTFFHRAQSSASGNLYIVQGGGFAYTPANKFTQVVTFPAVQNEPGISNREGTIAMAKLGGDPNSATSQFFVNLDNVNASNLDAQNGGFTVFGRIAGNGLAVMKSIMNLQRKNYTVTFGTTPISLTDVPVTTATTATDIEPQYLVKLTTVDAAPILTYAVNSLNNAVATASLAGTDITITGVKKGYTKIHVTATDLDGQSVTQDIPVNVQ